MGKNSGAGSASLKLIIYTIRRFPMTIVFLVSIMALNAAVITNDDVEHYSELMLCFILGASLSAALQIVWERFFKSSMARILFMLFAAVSSLVYLVIVFDTDISVKASIRTIIILFMLFIAFIWVPSIKSRVTFYESFLAVFRAFFIAVFFAGVIFLGVYLIITAIDQLIADVDERAYLHAANIIAILYAPIHFLSLIPAYDKEVQENAEEAQPSGTRHASRFLEGLISYVFIPVTSLFTVILLLYIIINITGAFWKQSLLEPLLVSYSITVIVVYLLSANLQNVFAKYFRRIFPKVLVPVVLFQTISSILKINELGITYGRYYVILFGLFATACGVIFCIIPAAKIGVIAPILLIMSAVSVIPPVDAFTVSRINQAGRLKKALEANDMLEGNTIIPGKSLSSEDKQTIRSSLEYLRRLKDTGRYDWLASYNETDNFSKTFGFNEYEINEPSAKYISLSRDPNRMIPISGLDYMGAISLSLSADYKGPEGLVIDNMNYSLEFEADDEERFMVLYDDERNEIIRASINEFFKAYEDRGEDSDVLTLEEASYTAVSNLATMIFIADQININNWNGESSYYASGYVFINLN